MRMHMEECPDQIRVGLPKLFEWKQKKHKACKARLDNDSDNNDSDDNNPTDDDSNNDDSKKHDFDENTLTDSDNNWK